MFRKRLDCTLQAETHAGEDWHQPSAVAHQADQLSVGEVGEVRAVAWEVFEEGWQPR